jgi:hypothetical protein
VRPVGIFTVVTAWIEFVSVRERLVMLSGGCGQFEYFLSLLVVTTSHLLNPLILPMIMFSSLQWILVILVTGDGKLHLTKLLYHFPVVLV